MAAICSSFAGPKRRGEGDLARRPGDVSVFQTAGEGALHLANAQAEAANAQAEAANAKAEKSSSDALIVTLKLEIAKLRRELYGVRSSAIRRTMVWHGANR
jgi:hypothetical protein